MATTENRQPDFKLTVFDKATSKRGEVGAAWKDSDTRDSITIVLNPGCSLVYSADFIYNLWPNETKTVAKRGNVGQQPAFDDFDNDIPF